MCGKAHGEGKHVRSEVEGRSPWLVSTRIAVARCVDATPNAKFRVLLLGGLNRAGYHLLYAVHQGFSQLVFPEPNHHNTLLLQHSRMSPVTHPVALQFRFPEAGVGLRHMTTFGTAMPKATVNENG